jgi:hypothetical protein
MPHILVIADHAPEGAEPPIMFRERVNVRDFESSHFAVQLVERLGWAVGDADAVARRASELGEEQTRRSAA